MKTFTKSLDRALGWLLVILLSVMILTVTWQVLSRFVFSSPAVFTERLASYLLIWLTLLGAPYALRVKAHLGIDILTKSFRGARKHLVVITTYLSIFLFSAAVFIFGGIRLTSIAYQLKQPSGLFSIPVWVVYVVIPVSGILLAYYSIVALIEYRTSAAGNGRTDR